MITQFQFQINVALKIVRPAILNLSVQNVIYINIIEN